VSAIPVAHRSGRQRLILKGDPPNPVDCRGLCLPRALPDCVARCARNAGAASRGGMGGTSLATLYLDLQMLESCRTAGLQARIFVFAGSAPLQWRIFVDHAAHERRWSGALQRGRLMMRYLAGRLLRALLTIFLV